jgi:hypothetical protein
MCSIIDVSVTDVDAKSNRSNAPATHECEKKKKHLEAASSNVGVFPFVVSTNGQKHQKVD